jgi:short-subunit dehydrogenase
MKPRLDQQVVVVTGASSGIGRETALLLAERGACVVAVARNETALATLVQDIQTTGGQAEAVVADVADYGAVERAGDRAIERFGRIDTWINNAAVSIYARFDSIEPDELDRVVRVDLLGQMFGSKVALAKMQAAGRGTIVNVGSVLSDRGVQLQVPYVASKHGVAGFTEALRVEVKETTPDIDVVLILPSSINTPFFDHARSKLGTLPAPIPPVYDPRVVAEAIVHAAEHGGREIVVGGAGKLLTTSQRLSSTLMDRYMMLGRQMEKQQEADRPDDRRDNLFEPSTGSGSVRGEFGEGAKTVSLYTRELELHPMRKRALALLAVVASVALVRKVGT